MDEANLRTAWNLSPSLCFVIFALEARGATFELLDGSTVIMKWGHAEPNVVNGMGEVTICGLSAVGSVGNSMTLKFDTSVLGGEESVNLVGHDAT